MPAAVCWPGPVLLAKPAGRVTLPDLPDPISVSQGAKELARQPAPSTYFQKTFARQDGRTLSDRPHASARQQPFPFYARRFSSPLRLFNNRISAETVRGPPRR